MLAPLVVHWLLVTGEPLMFTPPTALIVHVALMFPATSSLDPGVAVPMPTLPAAALLMLLPLVDHWLLVTGEPLMFNPLTALTVPPALMFPDTSRLDPGVSAPMPTLPA